MPKGFSLQDVLFLIDVFRRRNKGLVENSSQDKGTDLPEKGWPVPKPVVKNGVKQNLTTEEYMCYNLPLGGQIA